MGIGDMALAIHSQSALTCCVCPSVCHQALLQRAVRLKQQQDRLAPLFLLIARQRGGGPGQGDTAVLPTACRSGRLSPSALATLSLSRNRGGVGVCVVVSG